MTPLCQNIINLRKRLALSQQDVALYLNISHTIMSHYETDKYPPTPEHLSKLADLFDVEIADLFEVDAENKARNLDFAFKTDKISFENINTITQFKKIIQNYLKLQTIEAM